MPKYHYNTNAFNKICTEEDAYWLGFLLADGYIGGGTKPFLQIKLGAIDKDHLIKFLDYLKYDSYEVIKTTTGGAYTKDNICYVVKISCRQISENLKQYGLGGPKSAHEIPYLLHNKELEKHYIRGIIDGDGWIRETQSGFGICGSHDVMSYIKNYIHTYIVDVSQNSITTHGTIHKFELTSKLKTQIILDYFYKDANIYLTRKFDLYKKFYCRG